MHRIPMQLKTPTVFWDRKLPEYILFDRTLNQQNVEETDNFLAIIDKESRVHYENSYINSSDELIKLRQQLGSNDYYVQVEAMLTLNRIVLQAPKDSPALSTALRLRGIMFFGQGYFESASNDFEMFLHVQPITKNFEELSEVTGNLVVCFYFMRQYDKSKKYLRTYNRYKAKIPRECFSLLQLVEIDKHIEQFVDELDDIENVVPKFLDDIFFSIPFRGFNTGEDIPLSSAACYYISDKSVRTKPSGVYANCEIPNDSIVIVEHPIFPSIKTPFIQCELCFRQREHIYTCLECRYKTYCSLGCMEKDKPRHHTECIGYKYLTLLILDASCLFRMFMRISELLHEHVFTHKLFRKLTTAKLVLEKLESIINEKDFHGINYLKLLNNKPDYQKLSEMQYSTLLTTVFRLTIFIEKKTLAFESFYKKLHISNKQKLTVVGAILMRLNYHIIRNTFDFEYNYLSNVVKPNYQSVRQQIEEMSSIIQPHRDVVIENIERHYKIDLQVDILERKFHLLQLKPSERIPPTSLLDLEHTHSCNPIQRLLSTYKDSIAELYFNPDSVDSFLYGETAGIPITKISAVIMCGRISEMTNIERYQFVQTFVRLFHLHFAGYFLNLNMRLKGIQQILALLCPTLRKFRHSCDPNVEVVVLENGVVMGKTLRHVMQGEELVVSYKANYMQHTRVERQAFLKRLDIECRCKYCAMPKINEPTNIRLQINCVNCKASGISPFDGKCTICRTSYKTLLIKYQNEIELLENEIKRKIQANADDRELYIVHTISYVHAIQCFAPCNEFRISIELRHAKFLALKSKYFRLSNISVYIDPVQKYFAQQSYNIVMEVKTVISQNYDESIVWFTFYADILLIIKIILYYNLDESLYSIATSCLEELCKLGLHIINVQKHHIHFYETFDYATIPILEDLQAFAEWKKKIVCNDLVLVTDSLKKLNRKGKPPKAEQKIMPTLAR